MVKRYLCAANQSRLLKNLYAVLRHLLHRHHAVKLWVDALCIDQGNILERNVQIEMMGAIYEKASLTWIWLGEEAEESNLGMELARSISLRDFTQDQLEQNLDSWKSVLHLFRRSWWSRLWIVQEAHVETTSGQIWMEKGSPGEICSPLPTGPAKP
jgi:hypothetical protein